MASFMALLFTGLITGLITFSLGFALQGSITPVEPVAEFVRFAIWPLFWVTIIAGACGGFVHALEDNDTHEIKVPFHGKQVDSGVWGHVFIGICGSIVALAVMVALFDLKIENILVVANAQTQMLKTAFYVAAIGIVGGYSGLPIISLVSNAALKKVQRQVEELTSSDVAQQEKLSEVSQELEAVSVKHTELQHELAGKEKELKKVTLQSILLTAERNARNGDYIDAINAINTSYLPQDSKNPKVYILLALCEKRLGSLDAARSYINASLELKKSSLGYFNLACYTHLLGKPVDGVYEAIRNAWIYSDTMDDKKRLVNGLQTDSDFASLRGTEVEFDQILKGFEAELLDLEG